MGYPALGDAQAMTDSHSGGSDGEHGPPAEFTRAVDAYLRDKGKGPAGQSGQYRRNAERVLKEFVKWCGASGIRTWADLDADDLRAYARDELLDEDLSPRTIHKYYDYISAWIGWCQREGLVDEHYGRQERAREPLPDQDTRKTTRQQTWLPDQRRAIIEYVDDRAREAIDEDGMAAIQPVRDRALVALLAYTGVRGSEILANRHDDRRDGATWDDMGEDFATLTVLSKKQEWTERAVPQQARPAIERWETLFDAPDDWPLFPTLHYPSLYAPLREAGYETAGFDGYQDVFDAYREAGIAPPSLSTEGARNMMQRLTDEAGINVDDANYLQLHGARRGVGRTLALEQGVTAAADQLDNSVDVVEEAYSDVLAKERAERTSEAFDQHDG